MTIADLASTAAMMFAHPVAIVAIIVGSIIWGRSRWQNSTLTLLLSILAITMTQLVLLDGQRTDLATQAKLDALLARERDAGRKLVRAEDLTPEEIERMRR